MANLEFHHTGDAVNEVARQVVARLERAGHRAVNPAMGFPMEMDRFPGNKIWVVSHKPVAVAAGLGMMGIHRNVIHPKFGNFILLGTVLIDTEATELRSAARLQSLPRVQAVRGGLPGRSDHPDGGFNFSACYTHNYREFMGGFTDWVETIAGSKSGLDYRRQVSDPESASMWQSLSFGPNYKAAYCLSVCPAGEDVIGPYLTGKADISTSGSPPDRERRDDLCHRRHRRRRARRPPLSPQEDQTGRQRPASRHDRLVPAGNVAHVSGGQIRRPGRRLSFFVHRPRAAEATVTIRGGKLTVEDGHVGEPNLRVTADSETWLGFLAKERSLVWALLRRKIRIHGRPRLLLAFGKCFPS